MNKLEKLSKLLRYYILISSTAAASGHPTSSLSAVELMNVLMFGGFFRYDLKNPAFLNNDRLIFSKGHASPLYYGLWATAGELTEKELLTFRQFESVLEGHPTPRFKFTEAATGSLGQGLSVGVGQALNGKYLDKLPYKVYVLLGDSEMAEGSNYEAMQLASYYKLDNLVAIVDVNGLGQRGKTMDYQKTAGFMAKAKAFGWQAIEVDGHNISQIQKAYQKAQTAKKPVMIVARTLKGKGFSLWENKDNWHGKPMKPEQAEQALQELGKVDKKLRGVILFPRPIKKLRNQKIKKLNPLPVELNNDYSKPMATRKAYGQALVKLYKKHPEMVVLDAETSNSTYAEYFKFAYPERFFEMFIAEQNMVGAAVGLAKRGNLPFVSTFAAFLTRAADQIRMSQYCLSNIKYCGSHAGVSIGEDGASQMGLEDIALFRSLRDSVVLYPSDRISAEKLTFAMADCKGLCYLRTTRSDTPVLYSPKEEFVIGGSKVLKKSKYDKITVIGAGITLHEVMKAYLELLKEKIQIRVIDLYSIKPLDLKTLSQAAKETKAIITVEDHYQAGGLGEAVASALSGQTKVHIMAVEKMPRSGQPAELLAYENIDAKAIVSKVRQVASRL